MYGEIWYSARLFGAMSPIPRSEGGGRHSDPNRPHRASTGVAGQMAASNLDGVTSRVARLLVVVPSETDPPARLGEWLRAAALDLDERHLGAGDDLPATLDGHDGVLVLGGPQSALDGPEAGLDGVREVLRRAVAVDLPT